MSTTLATCSRCAWTYTPGKHGPIVALRIHWQREHGPVTAVCTVQGCREPSAGWPLCMKHDSPAAANG